jgi:N,N'-diacetyllegionaminate synthase
MVTAAADCGVDGVKFQNRLGCRCKEFRPGTFFPQDECRDNYWERTLFSTDEWAKLSRHVHDLGLHFCCSVFSLDGMRQMAPFVNSWKAGASELDNLPLIEAMGQSGKPVILSSGMSDWEELDAAVRIAWRGNCPELTVLQCTSEYPCPPEKVGLNVMEEIKERYCAPPHYARKFGLSDHSGQIWAGIAAATLGADMLEVHCTWDQRSFGPDATSSLTFNELEQLVWGVRFVTAAQGRVDKDAQAAELEHVRKLFRPEESEYE